MYIYMHNYKTKQTFLFFRRMTTPEIYNNSSIFPLISPPENLVLNLILLERERERERERETNPLNTNFLRACARNLRYKLQKYTNSLPAFASRPAGYSNLHANFLRLCGLFLGRAAFLFTRDSFINQFII